MKVILVPNWSSPTRSEMGKQIPQVLYGTHLYAVPGSNWIESGNNWVKLEGTPHKLYPCVRKEMR